MKQWKLPVFLLQFIAKLWRLCPTIGHLATIGAVLRARRDRNVRAGVHVEPPEGIGNYWRLAARSVRSLAQRVPHHGAVH